jgi:hypothetical protein
MFRGRGHFRSGRCVADLLLDILLCLAIKSYNRCFHILCFLILIPRHDLKLFLAPQIICAEKHSQVQNDGDKKIQPEPRRIHTIVVLVRFKVKEGGAEEGLLSIRIASVSTMLRFNLRL